METLAVWVLLEIGLSKIEEPASPMECTMMLAMADAAFAARSPLWRGDDLVVRLACGGRDVVLSLPISAGPCELGA